MDLNHIDLIIAPEERAKVAARREALLRGEPVENNYEARGIRKNGDLIWVDAYVRVVNWDGQEAIQCNYIDSTGRKRAEEQLNSALRMEALGQLTGGVAHEFNNLLQIIVGNVYRIGMKARNNPELADALSNIEHAAKRGANLTSRFLSFGGKQLLRPQIVDVGAVVSETIEMMRQPLGETIAIVAELPAEPLKTFVDKGQLKNAFVNIFINAGDAMPDGGTLTINAERVSLDESFAAFQPDTEPGDYIMVAITDTGCGMPPDVKARVFEPFFTTKGLAEHSGLGLSMIYGFVKQSAGHIEIESQPAHGATVKLFLPVAKV